MIEVTREGSAPEAVARLRIVCPHHHEEVLVEVCRSADGEEWVENVRGVTTESVAAPGTREAVLHDLAEGRALPFPAPEADADSGDVPHLRKRFRCPRPSCGYDGQVRVDHYWPASDALLSHMVQSGTALHTVTNVDSPGRWHLL